MNPLLIDAMAKQMAFDDAEKDWVKLSGHEQLWYKALAHSAYLALLEAGYQVVRKRVAEEA